MDAAERICRHRHHSHLHHSVLLPRETVDQEIGPPHACVVRGVRAGKVSVRDGRGGSADVAIPRYSVADAAELRTAVLRKSDYRKRSGVLPEFQILFLPSDATHVHKNGVERELERDVQGADSPLRHSLLVAGNKSPVHAPEAAV